GASKDASKHASKPAWRGGKRGSEPVVRPRFPLPRLDRPPRAGHWLVTCKNFLEAAGPGPRIRDSNGSEDDSMRRLLPAALLLLGAAASVAGPARAQDEEFTLNVNVELVELRVAVLDAEGRFVSGLEAEDFEVLEN